MKSLLHRSQLMMILALGSTLLDPEASTAASRYWIASAAANWNSAANWSTISGGAGGASVPGSADVAFFDAARLGNCIMNVNVNVLGINVNGYTGTIFQNAGITVTVGTTGYTQSSGTFTGANSAITLNGAFTLSGGTFTATSNNINVNANWTISGGTFNPGSGTVRFSSALTIIGSHTLNNMTCLGASTKTLASSLNVNGNLTISAGTLNLASYTANRSALGGTMTISNGATLTIGGTNTVPSNYSTHSIGATSTIEYAGGDQSIVALNSGLNYGHLTISGSGNKTLATTVGVRGNLTVSAATLDLGSFTANRTTNGGSLAIANGATLIIGGTGTLPSSYSTHSIGATSTVNYAGTNQNVAVLNSSQSYGYLTISGSGNKTLNGSITVRADLLISAGALNLSTFVLSANAGVINQTSCSGSGRISLTGGTVAHTLDGNGTYVNLQLNDANGVILASNATVNGTLTLSSGLVSTGIYTLVIGSSGTISRTSGHVVGNLQKRVAVGSPIVTFEIGDNSFYTPIQFTFVGVSVSGDLRCSTTGSDHPNMSSSTLVANRSVNRFWSMSPTGLTITSCNATFNFNAADVDAGVLNGSLVLGQWSGALWSYPAIGSRTPTSIQATGLTSFGDYQIAEPKTLSVSVSDNTFSFGVTPLDTWLTPQSCDLVNNGNVPVTFVGRISQLASGPNTWDLSTMTNGSDMVRAQWSTAGASGPWVDVSAYDSDFNVASNIAADGSVTFFFRIQTPSTSSSFGPYQSTLTVTAQEY